MPEPKKPGMQCQGVTGKAIGHRGSGELLNSEQVSFQVGPAELGNALVVLDIGAEAIGAQDAQKLRPQHLTQHFGTAALGDRKDYEATCHENPEPAFRAITTPASFIPVEDGFVGKLLLEFLMGGLQGRAGLFDRFLGASETDAGAKDGFQQFFHLPSGHAADNGQISEERRQLRPEMIEDFSRNRGPRDLATVRADDFPELVLDNVGSDFGKLGDLMPVGLTFHGKTLSVIRKLVTAVFARWRQDWNHFIRPFGRNQGTVTSGMPFLSAGLAPGLLALGMNPFVSRRPVRRRWFGRVGRILLSPRQLVLKVSDFLFEVSYFPVLVGELPLQVSDPSLKPFVLPLQPFVFSPKFFSSKESSDES